MKKTIVAVLALSLTTTYYSCTKDKTNAPDNTDCTLVDAATNTYDLKIKTIMDDNCAFSGCHNAASARSGVVLDSYIETKNAVANKDVLCAIRHANGCEPMPSPSDKLADSLITFIACWKNNGYPQ